MLTTELQCLSCSRKTVAEERLEEVGSVLGEMEAYHPSRALLVFAVDRRRSLATKDVGWVLSCQ